tara:strand:- start:1605 stop:2378 length:774 start_codon:yes stop_codon:yes gene_type:complete
MNKPIGIFDSGIGGLSILNGLSQTFPKENFIYLADNKNCPYGKKSSQEITALSVKNCNTLIQLDCKMIIVACNTATTNSIEHLRRLISIPIIGIEPGIKPAINYTKTNNIGILATEKTLESKLFLKTSLSNKTDKIKIHEQIGHNLVNKIENGADIDLIKKDLIKYINPMLEKNIDCLVLGCTHYHFITSIIKKIIPKKIKLIDTITPIIQHIKNTLLKSKSLNTQKKLGTRKVFYNGDKIIEKYLKEEYDLGYINF